MLYDESVQRDVSFLVGVDEIRTRKGQTNEVIGPSISFREVERADLDQISFFMTYWLNLYHQWSGADESTLELLRSIYSTNMDLLERYTSEEGLPGYYFYVAEDSEGGIAGTTGFMTNEHMDPCLKEKLHELGTYTAPDGITYDMTRSNIPEIYYLHTSLDPKFRKQGIGNKLMDLVKKEAQRLTGSDCMAFSSREVWHKSAWPFHDKRPDFHLFHKDIKDSPLQKNTRGYIVTDLDKPISM